MNSLRGKIILGYLAIAALVAGLSLFSFMELRVVEQRIATGARIGEFFDIALEIRRFEKNYFLYRQPADLAENGAYVKRAQALLAGDKALFEALAEPARIAHLTENLDRYAALVAEYGQTKAEALAAHIRQTGKDIVDLADELAKAERGALQAMLDRHRHMMIASVAFVGLLVIAIGQWLTRRVGRPLKEMETHMEEVAAGKLRQLDITGDDREIVSLTQAFNHVMQELNLRQGQLVRSEKLAALGTLLSGVAHELNNPLSNISTSCQILTEEIDLGNPEFRKELLDQILDETWRARRIVRSLLDYARDREFLHEVLPLAPLIEETLRLIGGRIPAGVTVDLDVAADLTAYGDRQRLQQVLINVIGNAVEAVADAGQIEVSARRTAQPCPSGALVFGQCSGDREALEIAIRDNGPGIPADVLPRIFDPFFTTKEVGHGLGLGLFIVFEIIEEHGGCIAVTSATGQGTTFQIRLPMQPGETHV
jgi:signal transduction histidine kinase